MPINFNTTATATNGIADLAEGTVFNFTSSTKGNNGLCQRIRDTKAGKGRFFNLENSKVLTSAPGDQYELVPAGSTLVVS